MPENEDFTQTNAWREFEPHHWGGPLATIQRAEPHVLQRYRQCLTAAGAYWTTETTRLFKFACPPVLLAAQLSEHIVDYAERAVTQQSEPIAFDETQAVERLIPALAQAVRDSEELIYPFAGQRLTVILYDQMTFCIRRQASLLGNLFLFGDLGQVWAEYLKIFGHSDFDALLEKALHSVVRLSAYVFVKRSALHHRPLGALEWYLGVRDNPQHFLVSEMELAARRADEDWLENLTTAPEYLGLPHLYSAASDPKMNFHKNRVTGDEEDWQMRYAVAEAVAQSGWREAERPFAYVAETARRIMRSRVKENEQEHIKARGRLISLDDLGDEIVELPAEALVPLKTDTVPVVYNIHSLLDEIELDPDVREVYQLYAKGVKWKDIATQLSWTTQRVEAARAKFIRAKPRIKEALADKLSWKATTNGPIAGGPAYVERFYSGARVWTHPPVDPLTLDSQS
jgi:hypothetical protein